MKKKTVTFLTIACTLAMLLFLIFLIQSGCLKDPTKMEMLLKECGIFGPLLFCAIQIIQVIVPILPGGVSCGIGVLVFGPIIGFLYNYLGLMIGAILLFLIVRKYGKKFILHFTAKEQYDKYIHWLDKGKKFEHFFAFAIFIPGMPDDLLCMIAALTKMRLSKYIWINAICKPFSLFLYSWGLKEIILRIGALF